MKERNMNYRNFHDRQYKSWTPEYTAVHSRSDARGVAIVLLLAVAILTLIFA